MKKRFTEQQVVAILRDAELAQRPAPRGVPPARDQRADVLRLAAPLRRDGGERGEAAEGV